MLGIWRAGLTWIPANPASPTGETAHLLAGFDAELVIFHAGLDDAASGSSRTGCPASVNGSASGPTPLRRPPKSPPRWPEPAPGTTCLLTSGSTAQPATKPAVDAAPEDVVSLAPPAARRACRRA